MSKKYGNLLSPIKIGGQALKSRLIYPQAINHTLQGSEDFPASPMISFLSGVAKNGAAIVTVSPGNSINAKDRFVRYNLDDKRVLNYVSQMFDEIHFFGAKATMTYNPRHFHGSLEFSPRPDPNEELGDLPPVPGGDGQMFSREKPYDGPVMSEAQMDELIHEMVNRLKVWKYCGADMVSLRLETYLSPLVNLRTDEYGGSLENRARFPLRIFEGIKEAVGRDFLIEVIIFADKDAHMTKGLSVDEAVAFAKLVESTGNVDLLTLRQVNGGATFYVNRPESVQKVLSVAEAIKAAGVKLPIAVTGGFQNPNVMEQAIASGKTDMVVMGRGFVCDYEFGKKVKEGRGEDVVPCVMCNKCHNYSEAGPSIHYCTVNPVSGLQHKIDRLVKPQVDTKKVAIIGGGPAGMEAAQVLVARGHRVDLFEKANALGGQLIHADHVDFKWTYKRFKDYMIDQLAKTSVNLHLGVNATPEMIAQGDYDVVIAALGAEPNIPDIEGLDEVKFWTAAGVYGKSAELGEKVIVIGGSLTGTETGIYLAKEGHKVTVLTRQKKLCADANFIHSIQDTYTRVLKGGYEITTPYWDKIEGFNGITGATTVCVKDRELTYQDSQGQNHVLDMDSLVVSGGMNGLLDEALAFSDAADCFYMIGDCKKVENVAMAVRTAFEAASAI